MITGSEGLRRFSSVSRPKPFMPAIRTSLSTMSAVDSGNSLSACSALSASVTRKPAASKVAAIMRRMLRSSSTTRMLANSFLPNWNVYGEGGAAPEFTACENSTVMRLDNLLGDIEPQSRGTDVSGIIGKLCEWFKDARQDVRRNSRAVVAHNGARDVARAPDFQRNGAAGGRVAKRIADQVRDHPRQLDRVAPNRNRALVGDDIEGDVLLAGLNRQGTAGFAHGPVEHDGAALDADARGALARRIEEIGRDRIEARDIVMDGVENLALAGRDFRRNRFGEQLGADGKRRQRGLQLMRKRRDKIGAAFFLIADIGYILQQYDGAQ